jgi:hypothetical protein
MAGLDQPVIANNENTVPLQSTKRTCSIGAGWVKEGIKLLKASLDGAAKAYSPFFMVVIIYDFPGLELLIPVLLGSLISVSDQIFKIFPARFKDNKTIVNIAAGVEKLNLWGVGYLADWGFTWNMFLTVASHVLSRNYLSSEQGKAVLLGVSAAIGVFIRYTRHTHEKKEQEKQKESKSNFILGMLADTLHSAAAPTFILRELKLQGQLAQDSWVPLIAVLITGTAGCLTSLSKKPWPPLAVVLKSFTSVIEEASLATALLSFPLDIDAAMNQDEVSEEFFGGFAIASIIYWLSLFALIMKNMTDELDNIMQQQYAAKKNSHVDRAVEAEEEFLLLINETAVDEHHKKPTPINFSTEINWA